MATTKYRLRKNSINLQLSIARGKVFERKTGLYIDPNLWSSKLSLPKQTTPENKKKTKQLKELAIEVIDRIDATEEVNSLWLKHRIDVFFERASENKKSELVLDAINNIIEEAPYRKNQKKTRGLSQNRIKDYKSFYNRFSEYEAHTKKKYKIKDISPTFAKKYLKFLIEVMKYGMSTAMGFIGTLKTVCVDAQSNEILAHEKLKDIDTSTPPNEGDIYLNPQELQQIKDADITTPHLLNARKWLLFGCDIGQRGGDFLRVTKNDFDDKGEYLMLKVTQKKTGKKVTIPILGNALEVYNDGMPHPISIQKFNDYIKVVCELSGLNNKVKGQLKKKVTINFLGKEKEVIRNVEGLYYKWELASSHVCRRSFSTNYYGILPTAFIIQITQHSTEREFLGYIQKEPKDFAKEIADLMVKKQN